MSPPELFDRAVRRVRRDRAARGFAAYTFLRDWMLDGIADRLEAVKRDFTDVLDLGCFDGGFAVPGARMTRCDAGREFSLGGVHCDEDRLPFAPASFDLIVSAGVLDTVSDLPGALVLIRRALRPGGLFLGALLGNGALPVLRAALREAEPEATRMHPQVDVRGAGDLLLRAGFALPVADVETLDVRYRGLAGLVGDLRGMAATNLMPDRRPMTRATLAAATAAFDARADPDGRVTERFATIFLTGWAPDAPGG